MTAEDDFNNTDTLYSGTVAFSSTDSTATFVPANSVLKAGTGTFSATLHQAGSQTLIAAAGSIGGTSGTIAVAPTSTNHFAILAPAATAGSAFSFTVTAEDPYGNTAPSYAGTVTFASTDTAATLPPAGTLSSGVGTFSMTLRTAPSQTLTASDSLTPSITGTSGSIPVSPTAATHFVIGTPPAATAGSAFSFTVTAEDRYNNTATGYTGTVALFSSDSAAALPSNSTLASGVGTFSAILKTAGSQRLTAADTLTSSITGTSAATTVQAAAAARFALSTPAGATAGSVFSFTVTAQDPYGNTAFGYAGTVTFASSDTTAALAPGSTLAGGVGTFTATLTDSGQPDLDGQRSAHEQHRRDQQPDFGQCRSGNALCPRRPGHGHGGQRLQLHRHG